MTTKQTIEEKKSSAFNKNISLGFDMNHKKNKKHIYHR